MGVIDVEIGLSHPVESPYLVDLRYTSEDDIDRRLTEVPASFEAEELLEARLDADRYGRALGEALFHDAGLRSALSEARGRSVEREEPLRIRLNIGPSAPELHGFRWEVLQDPETNSPLFSGDRTFFSRYVSSFAAESSALKTKGNLRALVMVANPSDLTEKSGGSLYPIDPLREIERAQRYLADISISNELASGGQASIDTLMTELRRGVDILYLVCHGQTVDHQTWLYLETSEGKARRTPARELVSRLSQIQNRPRLIVLAACESAGKDESTEGGRAMLSVLGPALAAEAGIGAVLAMQGSLSLETLDAFLPIFFDELQRDGLVDRAVSVARGHIRHRLDWWAPVLFMRIRSGRLWYRQGYAGSRQPSDDEAKWKAVLDNIETRHCTPIVGPGLVDRFFGSRRQIARQWAEQFRFPMADYISDDLPQVAQYLAIKHQLATPRKSLKDYLKSEIVERYRDLLPPDTDKKESSLSTLISRVGSVFREQDDTEPHLALARLPIKVYVTTNVNNLLADSLAERDKKPRVEWCRWNNKMMYLGRGPDGTLYEEPLEDREPDYDPTPEEPLVYHLFGHLDEERSLVLTEDDYFDFLIGSTADRMLIPAVVRSSLTDAGLLFLGYQLDDWNFRVLFRSIIRLEGASRREDYAQMAVQIDPEGASILEPEGARKYLKEYFKRAGDINVYWGSSVDFVGELWRRWSEKEHA